ncbi:MAG: efflux transporter periplasmic adaptor subunit [Variovorax paradoxus]|nr:MAG: efflux transporter periplasmic adaptor subunit [Variovorax paradoxus]PZQ04477.1 MAG: efflux transporter periplasmic adaptor subunit [Variovorax paradoxus]
MNSTMAWATGVGGIAAIAALAWAFAPRPVPVELAAATLGAYEQSIVEDGKTRLRNRYVLTAPLAGRLARIGLREGDDVAQGDVLATLTPALSPMLDERSQREQSSRVRAAEAAVLRADASAQRAHVAQEQARVDLQRDERLAQDHFVSLAKVDAARLALQLAQRDLDAAVQARHVSQHELEAARAALAASMAPAKAAAGGFALRSPVAGRVLRIPSVSETTVALGTPVMEVGDTTQMEIVAELLTSDALQAQPGAAVRIERWGGSGTLEGRVRRVEPSAFTKVSALGVEEQRVNVVIDITSPPVQWTSLGDGFRVGVRIVTTAQPSVLRVPVSAVFPLADGGMAVFVADAGRARLTPVELGGRNGTQAWLRSGVQAGTDVIVYPPSALRDGARVRARGVALR